MRWSSSKALGIVHHGSRYPGMGFSWRRSYSERRRSHVRSLSMTHQ